MTLLDIRLFGSFQFTWDGKPANPAYSARQQSLLAYLLLHKDAPQPRRQIAFTLWPETAEKQALTNLRQLYHYLRTSFPAYALYITSTNRTLQWNRDGVFRLDVDEFTTAIKRSQCADDPVHLYSALKEAATLYRGPLFPDCYDDWILPFRERLHQQVVAALGQLIQLAESCDDYPQAVNYAVSLLHHDPLHEATYQKLIRLYGQKGDRAAAMRAFHDCAALLRSELGVEPSVETVAAYDRLLFDQEQATREPATHETHETTVREAEATDLIGRTDEWQQLRAVWEDAAAGRAQMFVVAGEAGMGKTRLAEELLLWNGRQGHSAIRTRSYAAAGDLAYGPIAEWLRADLLKEMWSQLDPTWLSEIARIVPELLVEQPTLPKPEPLAERWQRKKMFEALAQAFCTHTKPLLLLLDDLQWCDSDTLEFLHFLLRSAPGKPLLIVGTVRPEEVDTDHPLTDLLLQLRSDSLLSEIELEPLSEDAAAALANQTAMGELEPNEQRSIMVTAGGNPLYIVETVRSQSYLPIQSEENQLAIPDLAARQSLIPPRVYATIQHRLNALAPVARELASVAATIGRAFSFELLAAVSEYAEDAVVRGLDELWRRRLVREHGVSEYDFSHDRIRDVAYGEIGVVERRALHGRVADELKCRKSEKHAYQIADHAVKSHRFEEATHYYILAAKVANNLSSAKEAEQLLHHCLMALRKSDDPTLQARFEGEVNWELLILVGNMNGMHALEVRQLAQQIVKRTTEKPEPLAMIRAKAALRTHYSALAMWDDALQEANDAIDLIPLINDLTLQQTSYSGLGQVLFYQGKFREAQCNFEEALKLNNAHESLLDREKSMRAKTFIYQHGALNLWMLGFPGKSRACGGNSLKMARQLSDPHMTVSTLMFVMRLQCIQQEIAECAESASELISLAQQYDFPYYIRVGRVFSEWCCAYITRNAEATPLVLSSIEQFYALGSHSFKPHAYSILSEVEYRAGAIDSAVDTAKTALSLSQQNGETFWLSELYRILGLLWEIQNDQESAVREYAIAVQIAQDQSAKSLELRATTSLARLWQKQGKSQEAHQILSEIYGWFTEGFETKDLIEAKALLDELSSSS